jgi:glycosyltransferase involved in cell wall biosynthesis
MSTNPSLRARREPLRVLHVINDLDVGGAERMLAKLVSGNDRARIRHTVVSLLPPGRVAEEIRAAGVAVASLDMRPGTISPGALARLVRMLRIERPHIVQSWLYHADLLATIAAPLSRVPALVWNVRCSDMDFSHYPRSTSLVVRLLARLSGRPAAVIANSEAGRTAHEQLGYRSRRWLVIPNGFDTDLFRPDPNARIELRRELGLTAEIKLVGMLARFDPMKDHATFLTAAARLAAARDDVHFVLAGRGIERTNLALAACTANSVLAGRLHLLGERADSARLFAALDLATLTSAFGEGCPNAVGEAMACATPCIATDVGDTATMIGSAGRIVPPGDSTALAVGWAEMLALPATARASLGKAARERIIGCYSLDTVRGLYFALYESLRSSDEQAIVRAVNGVSGQTPK